jgi:hypothetical protein
MLIDDETEMRELCHSGLAKRTQSLDEFLNHDSSRRHTSINLIMSFRDAPRSSRCIQPMSVGHYSPTYCLDVEKMHFQKASRNHCMQT